MESISDLFNDGTIAMLIVGAVAGALAGQVVKGGGMGIFANIAIGIIGGFIGNWLLSDIFKTSINTGSGLINSILTSFIGAVALLMVIGVFNGRRKR